MATRASPQSARRPPRPRDTLLSPWGAACGRPPFLRYGPALEAAQRRADGLGSTQLNAARTAARLAKARPPPGRVRRLWCRYSDTYGLAARLGFPSNEAAREANPRVEGSTTTGQTT